MKKLITLITLVSLFVLNVCAQHATPPNDNAFNAVSYRALPSLKAGGNEGVSASFTGTIGNEVIVAGGCNFAEKPAAKGGKKIYYNTVSAYNETDNKWNEIGRLPQPVAYGASATVPDGIVCMGGTDGHQSLTNVMLLQRSADGKLIVKQLPQLPIALDNMAGAYGGGYLYVAGGNVVLNVFR